MLFGISIFLMVLLCNFFAFLTQLWYSYSFVFCRLHLMGLVPDAVWFRLANIKQWGVFNIWFAQKNQNTQWKLIDHILKCFILNAHLLADLLDGGWCPKLTGSFFALKCGVRFGAVATVTLRTLRQNASPLTGENHCHSTLDKVLDVSTFRKVICSHNTAGGKVVIPTLAGAAAMFPWHTYLHI